ncbi:hypothetical protein Tco_0827717, partial [Tanacetum coccineum]
PLLTAEDFNLPCFKNDFNAIEHRHATVQLKLLILIRRVIEIKHGFHFLCESEEPTSSLNEIARQGASSVNTMHQQMDLNSPDSVGYQSYGIQKIIPSQNDIADDYWFGSNPEVRATELWGTDQP